MRFLQVLLGLFAALFRRRRERPTVTLTTTARRDLDVLRVSCPRLGRAVWSVRDSVPVGQELHLLHLAFARRRLRVLCRHDLSVDRLGERTVIHIFRVISEQTRSQEHRGRWESAFASFQQATGRMKHREPQHAHFLYFEGYRRVARTLLSRVVGSTCELLDSCQSRYAKTLREGLQRRIVYLDGDLLRENLTLNEQRRLYPEIEAIIVHSHGALVKCMA